MAIVSAKCPSCGASIQLENENKEGFCSFCGTKILIQETLLSLKEENSEKINNLLILAEDGLQANNHQMAYEYSGNVLENDPQNSDAWFIRMRAIDGIRTMANPRTDEIFQCASNAVKFNDTEEMSLKVDAQKLTSCASMISFCTDILSNNFGTGNEYLETSVSTTFQNSFVLADAVDTNRIKANKPLYEGLILIIISCLAYWKAIDIFDEVENVPTKTSTWYELRAQQINARRDFLQQLKNRLPDDLSSTFDLGELLPIPEKKGGCYIATAVYGSYDCPEVWTLRRFRDEVLGATWYGRLFIKTYYATSPILVKWLGKTDWFKKLWRSQLDKMVLGLKNKGFKDTPYKDRNW